MKNPFHYSHKKDYNGENRKGKYEANTIVTERNYDHG